MIPLMNIGPDGSETGKTKKGDRVYEITIPKDCTGYPVVK